MKYTFDWKEYAKIAREAAAEGCVLLKNDSETLPLKKGEKVQLVGFGTFETVKRAKRKGQNPQTKEKITIPASNAPKFKAGKALKEAVNSKKK